MNFLVFGAGALGSLVAARLAQAFDVTLVGRKEHVDAIRTRGLRVTGYTELHSRRVRALTDLEAAPAPDVVLVTVKAPDTASAAKALRRFSDRSVFVSLQNGLGNEDVLARSAPRVLGAVINQGVTFVEPGVVHHAGKGETILGAFAGTTSADAQRVADGFRKAGLEARVAEDIRTQIWAKVVLNAAVNPLTAILRRRTGQLLGDPYLEAAMADIVEESVAIARAEGIRLDGAVILQTILRVAEATRDNKSSMFQDLERGRRTEIGAINGALAERAKTHGLPAPLNTLLTELVSSAERVPAARRG